MMIHEKPPEPDYKQRVREGWYDEPTVVKLRECLWVLDRVYNWTGPDGDGIGCDEHGPIIEAVAKVLGRKLPGPGEVEKLEDDDEHDRA